MSRPCTSTTWFRRDPQRRDEITVLSCALPKDHDGFHEQGRAVWVNQVDPRPTWRTNLDDPKVIR